MQIEWEDNEAGTEAKARVDDLRLLISQYGAQAYCAGQWNWQARVGPVGACTSGIVETREEAVALCAAWADKGPDAIRAAVAAELLADIDKKVLELAEIDPRTAEKLPGFQAGYSAGLAAARQALCNLDG